MPFDNELRVALEAADRAGELILEAYESFTPIPDAPAHISTEVDLASQEAILRHIRAAFPDDALVAEETTPTLLESPADRPRVWVVDPIDGTRGFAQKNGEFSVMIALRDAEGIALGVVLEPVLWRLTYAVRGGGCLCRVGTDGAAECRVSSVSDPAALTLTQSRSRKHRPPTDGVRRLSPANVIETYSAGIKLAQVARGEADVYVNSPGFRDWDVCAGQILVEEAGGRVTDHRGGAMRYGYPKYLMPGGIIGSNGHVHEAVLRLMSADGD